MSDEKIEGPASVTRPRASDGSLTISYLEYFHEDLCFMFHILFVILCFGFGFKIFGFIFIVLAFGQFCTSARKLYRFKANAGAEARQARAEEVGP